MRKSRSTSISPCSHVVTSGSFGAAERGLFTNTPTPGAAVSAASRRGSPARPPATAQLPRVGRKAASESSGTLSGGRSDSARVEDAASNNTARQATRKGNFMRGEGKRGDASVSGCFARASAFIDRQPDSPDRSHSGAFEWEGLYAPRTSLKCATKKPGHESPGHQVTKIAYWFLVLLPIERRCLPKNVFGFGAAAAMASVSALAATCCSRPFSQASRR